jgi:hypothetical protein
MDARWPTLRASADRTAPFVPWLGLSVIATVAWVATHQGFRVIAPTTVAHGVVVLMFHTAVFWGRWREHGLALGATVVGALGWTGIRLSMGWIPGIPDSLGAGGVALWLLLVYRAATRDDEAAGEGKDIARLGVVFFFLTPLASTLAFGTKLIPTAWVGPALVLDESFPVHAFHVGQWLERWPVMKSPAHFAYDGIFVFVPALVALRLRLRQVPATDFLVVVIVTSLIGQACYFITPIMGPAYAFGMEFPDVLPPLANIPRVGIAAPPFLRNGLPSIHTAWALVFLWNTRPLGRALRVFGVFIVLFTVIATLGFGEHYVIDLVAAVPYSVAMQTLGTRVPVQLRRSRALVIATMAPLLLVWVLAPRWTWAVMRSPSPAWVVLAITTVTVALMTHRWFDARVQGLPAA